MLGCTFVLPHNIFWSHLVRFSAKIAARNCGSFLTASTEEDMEKQITSQRGSPETPEEDIVVPDQQADSAQLTPSLSHDFMTKIDLAACLSVEHTAASSAAPDPQDSLKLHRCERHGPHVCTWTTVPTPHLRCMPRWVWQWSLRVHWRK